MPTRSPPSPTRRWYDPLKKETNLNAPAIKQWIKNGAQPSDTVKNLLQRAVSGQAEGLGQSTGTWWWWWQQSRPCTCTRKFVARASTCPRAMMH